MKLGTYRVRGTERGRNRDERGYDEVAEADFVEVWRQLREWRENNPAATEDAVRRQVRQLLLPVLPPPRPGITDYWLFLCITDGDLETKQTPEERDWLVWAYWDEIAAAEVREGRPLRSGQKPQPAVRVAMRVPLHKRPAVMVGAGITAAAGTAAALWYLL